MEGATLGSLFEGRAISGEDETAAQRLAQAFGQGASTEVAEAPPPAGLPTRVAPDEMTLDTVFRDSPRKSAETRRPANFTFDQFFTEGQGTAPASGSAPAEKGDADIEQFNSWLSGLKKK